MITHFKCDNVVFLVVQTYGAGDSGGGGGGDGGHGGHGGQMYSVHPATQ